MAGRGQAEVIDLCSSDDDMMIVEESPPRSGARGHSAAAAAARAAADAEDAALALRLQQEEWGSAPAPRGGAGRGGGGGGADDEFLVPEEEEAVPAWDDAHDTPDVFGRRARQEQDRAYAESLAADRKKEAAASAAAAAAAAAAREAEEAARRAAFEASEAERKERERVAAKEAAQNFWRSAEEPPAGAPGALALALRFPDGSRVTRRFDSSATVSQLFEWAACMGPFSDIEAAAFSLTWGFPARTTLARRADAAKERVTLAEVGIEAGAVLVSIPSS